MKCRIFAFAFILLAACGGAASETADQNRVFYDWASGDTRGLEVPFPALDYPASAQVGEYKGVAVLGLTVHLSRPSNWHLRSASHGQGLGYIQYISPNAYSFTLYERPESPDDDWEEVLTRFEADVDAKGAKVVGRRVPVASFGAQGRAYSVQRTIEAPKSPLTSHSREYLLRGDEHVVLLQIVIQGGDLSALDAELLRVVQTLEVL